MLTAGCDCCVFGIVSFFVRGVYIHAFSPDQVLPILEGLTKILGSKPGPALCSGLSGGLLKTWPGTWACDLLPKKSKQVR